MQPMEAAAVERLRALLHRIAQTERHPMARKFAAYTAPHPEIALAAAADRRRRIRMVEKERPVEGQFEIGPLQVQEIVAEAERQIDVRITDLHPRGPRGNEFVGQRGAVTAIEAVAIVQVALQQPHSEQTARRRSETIRHPQRAALRVEIVAELPVAPLVLQVPRDIAATRLRRRGVKVDQRLQRSPRPRLEVEARRQVELLVADLRGTDRPRVERRFERQGRHRIVDFGPHAHRVVHARLDPHLGCLPHARDIGLGHLDLFFHLGKGRRRQQRRQHPDDPPLFHHCTFSFWIRSFAAATMPSSAGE